MIDTVWSNAAPHRVRGFYLLNPSQRYQTLEPFNEAYSNYWYAEGSQEGCHFSPKSQIQIIRFFRQGYTFIDTGNAHALAALSPSGKELVVAVLNTTQSDRPFTLNLNKFANKVTQIDGWRTSKTEDCQALANIRHNKKQITYNSPAGSLTTFVIK